MSMKKISGKSNLIQMLRLYMLTVVVRSVFEEDGKYYPQVFLGQSLYEV